MRIIEIKNLTQEPTQMTTEIPIEARASARNFAISALEGGHGSDLDCFRQSLLKLNITPNINSLMNVMVDTPIWVLLNASCPTTQQLHEKVFRELRWWMDNCETRSYIQFNADAIPPRLTPEEVETELVDWFYERKIEEFFDLVEEPASNDEFIERLKMGDLYQLIIVKFRANQNQVEEEQDELWNQYQTF